MQGATAPVAGLHARRGLELRDELRIAARRRQGELEQALLAEGDLPDRRQHAGRNPRGAGRRRGPLDHRNAGAVRGGPPGAALADQACAHDYRVEAPLSVGSRHLACRRRSRVPAPALPGSGSDGRRRRSRPLSPWLTGSRAQRCYPSASRRDARAAIIGAMTVDLVARARRATELFNETVGRGMTEPAAGVPRALDRGAADRPDARRDGGAPTTRAKTRWSASRRTWPRPGRRCTWSSTP